MIRLPVETKINLQLAIPVNLQYPKTFFSNKQEKFKKHKRFVGKLDDNSKDRLYGRRRNPYQARDLGTKLKEKLKSEAENFIARTIQQLKMNDRQCTHRIVRLMVCTNEKMINPNSLMESSIVLKKCIILIDCYLYCCKDLKLSPIIKNAESIAPYINQSWFFRQYAGFCVSQTDKLQKLTKIIESNDSEPDKWEQAFVQVENSIKFLWILFHLVRENGQLIDQQEQKKEKIKKRQQIQNDQMISQNQYNRSQDMIQAQNHMVEKQENQNEQMISQDKDKGSSQMVNQDEEENIFGQAQDKISAQYFQNIDIPSDSQQIFQMQRQPAVNKIEEIQSLKSSPEQDLYKVMTLN